ncbi:hypothetical protein SKAU_G00159050 [Synaphobranchus kaupii]|uniref:Reverse transcriptase domain-containing protein n=1 Tax=Synaphobranchus kaupii TaxID=118154 RepID=A0A9Q1FI57_SYNKA|nr:hypothetical protein SKAU_G00159050 [Synaphobranchus kaupii]
MLILTSRTLSSPIKKEAENREEVEEEARPANCFSIGRAAPPAPMPIDLQQLKKELREEMASEMENRMAAFSKEIVRELKAELQSICRHCQEPGHVQRFCWQRERVTGHEHNPVVLEDFVPGEPTPPTVQYLGHMVSEEGVTPVMDKVQAVADWPQPQTVQQSVQSIVDPLQFTYQQNRAVDHTLLTLLHLVRSHLDTPKSYIRLVFVGFSSAFNTNQPQMAKKLLKMNLNPHLVLWVISFLTDRPQWVRYKGHCSTIKTISTGSPQGSVVSPVLFTLYTDDCQSNCLEITFIKYSDDTVIVDSSNSDDKLQSAVSQFQQWCEVKFLDLNVEKTK